MKITFLGAVQEVTGSKYLIEQNDIKILVDCGLFQGDKALRQRNWDAFFVDPSTIQAIVLTHAHLDHTGYIPALVKKGFRGTIYCSKPTYALCAILLKDTASLEEEDAKRANEYGSSEHVVPLYTVQDAEKALTFFKVMDYDTIFQIGALQIKLIQSSHILGSAFVVISDGKETLTFSGDLGPSDQLIMKSPTHLQQTDFLVLESTYGDRIHEKGDPIKQLGDIVNKVVAQKGLLIIPAFAIERTQVILYCLYQLSMKKIIPEIPIFLDSPMAEDVTNLFCQFKDEHTIAPDQCGDIFHIARYIRTAEESKSLNHLKGPAIIIAGSGMADGGRVMYHLAHSISDAKNIVLFVGYQAHGTNGHALTQGAKEIEIYGRWYPVFAAIEKMEIFSAHADYPEILEWLSSFKTAPKKVFVTHGELESSQALKTKIEERFGWSVVIPKYKDSFDLD